jgi:hypothetical protein
MRKPLLIATLVLSVCSPSAVAATTPTMSGSVRAYAVSYGAFQRWVLAEAPRFKRGDYRRAYFTLHYLANPAPGAARCFADDGINGYGYGCPRKWYTGGIEFYMDVEARVARCGPGWYVVSTPLDGATCPHAVTLPRWDLYR